MHENQRVSVPWLVVQQTRDHTAQRVCVPKMNRRPAAAAAAAVRAARHPVPSLAAFEAHGPVTVVRGQCWRRH